MKLEPAQCYETGDGTHVCVVGETLHYAHLFWSLQGDWYDIETGRRVYGAPSFIARESLHTTITHTVRNCLDYAPLIKDHNTRRAIHGRPLLAVPPTTETRRMAVATEQETAAFNVAAKRKGVTLRYAAYACAQGRSVVDQMVHDEDAYPGGKNTGFLLWISAQRQQFAKAHPEAMMMHGVIASADLWDRYLVRVALEATPHTTTITTTET